MENCCEMEKCIAVLGKLGETEREREKGRKS
jgi:hypothetical protein